MKDSGFYSEQLDKIVISQKLEMSGSISRLTEAFTKWSKGMMRRRSPPPGSRSTKCYSCGQEGHYASECSQKSVTFLAPTKQSPDATTLKLS